MPSCPEVSGFSSVPYSVGWGLPTAQSLLLPDTLPAAGQLTLQPHQRPCCPSDTKQTVQMETHFIAPFIIRGGPGNAGFETNSVQIQI